MHPELNDVASGFRVGDAAHVANPTLLPLTVADLEHLMGALGEGSAVILLQDYGNCRISSTVLANTWWVQYYNSSDAMILSTIEVTGMPDIVPAAAEDLSDGQVVDYAIIAPTEWHFHPSGPFAREGCGGHATSRDTARRYMQALALTLDPCIDYMIEWREPDHA